MKSLDKTQGAADELKQQIQYFVQKGMNRNHIRFHHHLMGMIELERKNFSRAIGNFEKAVSLLPSQYSPLGVGDDQALFLDSLALAYYKAGDIEKAREEYERITKLTTGRIFYGDIYAKSFYMMGKIYEQKGWKGKAIDQYEKFLNLWKDADAGIDEVEDAKKRLAGLKSNH